MSKNDGIIQQWCDCENPVAIWRDIAWIDSKDTYVLVYEPVEWKEEYDSYDLSPIIEKLAACYEVDMEEVLLWSMDALAHKDIFTDDIYEMILGDAFYGAFCAKCEGEL